MPPKKSESRFYVVEVKAECLTLENARAYLEAHEEDLRVVEGTERHFERNAVVFVDAPEQKADKPKRKYTRKPKAEGLKRGPNDGDAPTVAAVLDAKGPKRPKRITVKEPDGEVISGNGAATGEAGEATP